MNIGDAGFQFQRLSNQTVRQNSGTDRLDNPSDLSGNAKMTLAQEGQMFQGQVVDVQGNRVTIQMDDNALLKAQLGENIALNIGDELNFLVKDADGLNVIIKPFVDGLENMKDHAILRVLEGNNLTPSAKNYQIAEALMNQNMSVDKASMQKIMQQSYNYPDTNIDTLVSLNKLKIPVNEVNIGQYEAYTNHQHQIMQGIQELSDSMIEFVFNEVNTLSSGEESFVFIKDFLNSFSDFVKTEDSLNDVSVAKEQDSLSVIQDENQLELVHDETQPIEEKIKLQNSEFTLQSEEADVSKDFDLADFFAKNVVLDKVEDGKLKEFLKSDTFMDILGKTIRDKFSLNPKEMQSPSEVTELYRNIYEKTDRLIQQFGNQGGNAGEQMKEQAQKMQDRIDFMQNLSEMFSYAQLPVRIDGADRNTDLFVYMNKQRRNEKKEDVSAMLHLDMNFLGSTDVHVSLRGTMVHTKFYVEDEKSATIIDEHMSSLEQAIIENGFTLTNEVVLRESASKEKNANNLVIDEMLGHNLEQSVKRFSFDVRT